MSEKTEMFAAYRSRCGLCDETIQEGDRIELYEGEWCHHDCVVEETGRDDRA